MGFNANTSGRDLLGRISERFGIDGLVGVELNARHDDVVIMKLERIVSADEIDYYFPVVESGSIDSTTVVEVNENLRVTFQV